MRHFPHNAFWSELRRQLTSLPVRPTSASEEQIQHAVVRRPSSPFWLACFFRLYLARRYVSQREAGDSPLLGVSRSTLSELLRHPSRQKAHFRLQLRQFLKEAFAKIDPDVPDAFIMCPQRPPRVHWLDKSPKHLIGQEAQKEFFIKRRPTAERKGCVAIYCNWLPFFCLSHDQRRRLYQAMYERDPDAFGKWPGFRTKNFVESQRIALELALGHPVELAKDPLGVQSDNLFDSQANATARPYPVTLVLSSNAVNSFLFSGGWFGIFDRQDQELIIRQIDQFLHANRMGLHVIGWPSLSNVDQEALRRPPYSPKLPSIETEVTSSLGAIWSVSWHEYPRVYFNTLDREDLAARRVRAANFLARTGSLATSGTDPLMRVCRGMGWKPIVAHEFIGKSPLGQVRERR